MKAAGLERCGWLKRGGRSPDGSLAEGRDERLVGGGMGRQADDPETEKIEVSLTGK